MSELTLGQKLDQRRFTAMSNKMAALVDYILGSESTMSIQPMITGLIITSDGIVLAVHGRRDPGANTIIGRAEDFYRNWAALISAAELTPAEEQRVAAMLLTKVVDWRDDEISREGRAMAQGGLA